MRDEIRQYAGDIPFVLIGNKLEFTCIMEKLIDRENVVHMQNLKVLFN
jgi:hypothetical protein